MLVIGAGVVGLLTGLFARRLRRARGGGRRPRRRSASRRPPRWAWRPWTRRRWTRRCGRRTAGGTAAADRGADVVFQCRGRGAALATALRSLRPQRTVIDLAFYQDGADEVRLGEEFHHNGLAHPLRTDRPGARAGRGDAGTAGASPPPRSTCCACTATPSAAPLVTDVVPVADAPAVVADLAARRRHVVQLVFDCGRLSSPPEPDDDRRTGTVR